MNARTLLIAARLSVPIGLTSSLAWAQGAPPTPPRESDESHLAPIPRAKDLLSGHVLVGASGRFVVPFGEFDDSTDVRDIARPSLGVGGDLGLGVSRQVALGVWFDYASYDARNRCGDCSASTWGLGGFARYHLMQGFRFDPWLQLGAGYRTFPVKNAGVSFDYSGIEWLRLGLGGDYYVLSQLGVGPYAELSLGTLTKRPEPQDRSIYGVFSAGLRLVFDASGR
ncbi:MAG TPA: hypothetical protein VFQ61_36925 [Polyangiaceae bacterium]|nr:hypothetical protein [Polyangiaceae bacterium]